MELTAMQNEGICPRHVLRALRDRLNATVHAPDGEAISSIDKLRSKISSKPEHWASARKLSEQVSSDDVIFCTGGDIGIPVAALCGESSVKRSYPVGNPPKIVVYFHNIDRLRRRLALKLFGLADKIDVFMVNARPQTDYLRSYLAIRRESPRCTCTQVSVGMRGAIVLRRLSDRCCRPGRIALPRQSNASPATALKILINNQGLC